MPVLKLVSISRLLVFALSAAILLSVFSGCRIRGRGSSVTPDSEYYADTFRRGRVDVVCLQGMNARRGEPDTLFGCLLAAREKGIGTIALPEGVYLGHVAEFIVRSLKFYELEGHFERFYGYRIVLEFRESSVMERKEEELEDYSGMILGAAGELAMAGAGLAAVPLTPIIFAYKATKAEMKRDELAEDARARGLPHPTRSGGVVALRDIRDTYSSLARKAGKSVGIGGGDAVMETYMVETCYLELPETEEILHIAGRVDQDGKKPGGHGKK